MRRMLALAVDRLLQRPTPNYRGHVPDGYFSSKPSTNMVFLFFSTVMKRGRALREAWGVIYRLERNCDSVSYWSVTQNEGCDQPDLRAGFDKGCTFMTIGKTSPRLLNWNRRSNTTPQSQVMWQAGILVLAFLVTFIATPAHAQDQTASDAAQANNPLADITAFNLQNYYIGDFTTPGNQKGNQAVARFAQPVQLGNVDVLIRASLPYNTFPVGPGASAVSAIGDFDIFGAVMIDTGNPAVSFAVGPQAVAPTATDSRVGSDQWQLGAANVYFNAESPKIQYGYLLTWRTGVGNTNGRPRANLGAFQPFAFYQLGDGFYTGGAPIWTYNFQNDNYSVPLGLRFGKVFGSGDTVFNLFVEPQYSFIDRGNGLPKWQIYFALNMQFK